MRRSDDESENDVRAPSRCNDEEVTCCHDFDNNGNDTMSSLIRNELVGDSLQTQCLRVLAKSLPLHVEACGIDAMHSIMSTFPPWTLAALSMEASRQESMNKSVAYILGHHRHVERLSIVMSATSEARVNQQGSIDLSSILHPSLQVCRLQLGNLHLEKQTLDFIWNLSNLTHLSLRNCSIDKCGGLLHTPLPPSLQVLDLSDNAWVTDTWLLEFLAHQKHHHLLYVNVSGCPHVSKYVLFRLNFDFRGCPLISVKRRQENDCYKL